MRGVSVFLCALLLAGCVGSPPRPVDIARHDLGDLAGPGLAAAIPIARVDVRVAVWLDSPAQLYRLGYADPLRRRSYAENRWVAPPGELIERFLQRHILPGQPAGAARGCRLVLWLDELEQRFIAPQTSEVVLDARVSLQPLRGDAVLAQQAFRIVKPAPTPDARGGVMATRAAADALARDLVDWLVGLPRERPRGIAQCKEKQ